MINLEKQNKTKKNTEQYVDDNKQQLELDKEQ